MILLRTWPGLSLFLLVTAATPALAVVTPDDHEILVGHSTHANLFDEASTLVDLDKHFEEYYNEKYEELSSYYYDGYAPLDEMEGDDPPGGFLQRVSRHLLPERRRLVIGRILCLAGLANLCICDEQSFRDAIANASEDENFPTLFFICFGIRIELETPVDITNKAISIGCIRPEECYIEGRGQNLFVGAPRSAFFFFLTMEDGQAAKGGALHLTGGKTRMWNVLLRRNQANETGGAIHVEGAGTELTIQGSITRENVAGMSGGAVSVADGAKVNVFRSSFLDNNATDSGGALFASQGGTMDLSLALLRGNAAATANDIYVSDDTGTLVECNTLLGNSFCDGESGIEDVNANGDGNTNCDEVGQFGGDLRCTLLDFLGS